MSDGTGVIRPQFILMDDNARRYCATVVEDYLQQKTIVCMDWPARSHDHIPIEHVWYMLQVVMSGTTNNSPGTWKCPH